MSAVVHVAVGVIVKDDHILIAKRPDHLHQGGKWEFPGGKVDAGEHVHQALVRELQEELNIQAQAFEPLIQIRHHYPEKTVFLDVYTIMEFSGVPLGNEGQEIRWVTPKALYEFEFPEANKPIVSAINLPSRYLITGDYSSDSELFARVELKLQSGFRLLQWRAKHLDQTRYLSLAHKIASMCQTHGAYLQLNCPVDWFHEENWMAHVGLHLSSAGLDQLTSRPFGLNRWLSASCHDQHEIKKAEELGVDFAVLSPVNPTSSHPESRPMGISTFSSLVRDAKIPIFGLGGLSDQELPQLKEVGAQGVAAITAFWS